MDWIARKPHSIVPLAESLDLFRTEACRNVAVGYLALLESHGGIPAKQGFELGGFVKAMSSVALTAVTKPDQCILRIVGEALIERIGGNPVGRNYYDMVPAARRAQAMRAMNMVLDVPCAFRAEIEETYSDGKLRLSEAVGFPLTSGEPGVDGFIFLGDHEMSHSGHRLVPGATLLATNVTRRNLIDLGFGIDPEFEDLVAVPKK